MAYDLGLCSFRFTGGHKYLKVQDVMIIYCVVGYNKTSIVYMINIPT